MELSEIYALIEPQIVGNEITQANHDNGDACQRTATFFVITRMLNASSEDITFHTGLVYEHSMQSHETAPGVYRRTSGEGWANNPNNFSADQWSILQLAFAVHGDRKRLKEAAHALLLRTGFHQNWHAGCDCEGWRCLRVPDFIRPTNISVHIRGMGFWVLKPALYLLDLSFLLDLHFRKGSADYDNMLVQQLAYAQLKYPTLVSKLAWRLFDKADALTKIERYHEVAPEKNGVRGFAELFRKLIESIK